MHGGKTPSGIALPQTRHGRYSKYLPKRLLEDFGEAVRDNALLELTSEIALLDSRLGDLLKRVDTGESGDLWKRLKNEYGVLQVARQKGDLTAMNDALLELGKLITKGHFDYANWHEVSDLIDQRRRLVESERKRIIDLHQMVRADKFMLFVQTLADSVKRHVTDKDTLAAIQHDISTLLSME